MPPPPPQKPTQRAPLTIDDVAIDFSSITPASGSGATASSSRSATGAAAAAAAIIPGLLNLLSPHDDEGRGGEKRERASDARAYDPGLKGVTQRQLSFAAGGAAAGRRKKLFGQQPYSPPSTTAPPTAAAVLEKHSASPVGGAAQLAASPSATAATATTTAAASANAQQDALDFLISAQQKQLQGTSLADVQKRREAYLTQLRAFCSSGRSSNDKNTPTPAPAAPPTEATNVAKEQSPTAAFPTTGTTQTNSLHLQLFAEGVPDIEPWDRWTSAMPRYGEARHLIVSPASATPKQIHEARLDLVHHAVIPDTHYTRHYQYRDLEHPLLPKEYKTKDELKAERRERLRAKQERLRAERQKATSAAATLQEAVTGGGAAAAPSSSSLLPSSSAASRLLHDRLSTKTLALNMFTSSVLNPLAADNKVLQQYELRDLEHQRRNHDRHVAALPNQILKRERDQQRFASENPLLRAYRVFPIYSPAHLGKLRHYANDNLLRGFVLYVADCDALVVLAGGEKALRHLDLWILQKMKWEHPDTRATRLLTVPLMSAESLSFHLPKGQAAAQRVYKHRKLVEGASATADSTALGAGAGAGTGGKKSRDDASGDAEAKEAVFINMVQRVEEGEKFLRQLPAPSGPWADLCGIWRSAFLQDGLRSD